MGFSPIRDLIAHAGAELKATTIAKLGVESASETEENVSFLAPMVSAVTRRVLNHADSNRTEVAGTPAGNAGFAGIVSRRDGGPIGDAKREIANLHWPTARRFEMVGWCPSVRHGRRRRK